VKKRVKDINDVPEAFRSLYKKQGEFFVLQVEDDGDGYDTDTAAELAEAKAKLKEFRDNNMALNKAKQEQDALLKQYEGLDPTKVKELKEMSDRMDKDEDAQLIKAGKIDEVIKKRVGSHVRSVRRSDNEASE
jgi:multidrug resistance efflux pump